MKEMKGDRAAVDCLGSDQEPLRLAAAGGLTNVPRGFMATVKVIDPPRLLPVLKHFAGLDVAVGASAEGFTLRIGQESFEMHGAEASTAFLFSSSERQFTLPVAGPLRAAIEAGFPISLPDYC